MENTANHITLTGTLASLPEYSHQNHERRFFRFLLAVERLSGTEDLLPVLAAEDVLEQAELFEVNASPSRARSARSTTGSRPAAV